MDLQGDLPPPPPPPPQSLNYLELVGSIFAHFRDFTGSGELAGRYGPERLKDVTSHPFYQQMDARDPLPPSFERTHFFFLDARFGKGTIEIVFNDTKLVNVRSQQFFDKGLFRISKAKKFLTRVLVPYMEQGFGPATEHSSWTFWFKKGGVCGMAGWVPGQPAVTACLVDEEYK